MLVVHHIPWRILALPTPFCTALVVIIPTPFILIANAIKAGLRLRKRGACKRLLKQSQAQGFLIYTQRPDSTGIVEAFLKQQDAWQGVCLKHGRVEDRQFKAIEAILPRQLGGVYPMLLKLENGCLATESLHHIFYEQHMHVRTLEEIISACEGRTNA